MEVRTISKFFSNNDGNISILGNRVACLIGSLRGGKTMRISTTPLGAADLNTPKKSFKVSDIEKE
ncbi:MAG: hypothetical protein U0Z75_00265 [Deinococcaceae bacterium]